MQISSGEYFGVDSSSPWQYNKRDENNIMQYRLGQWCGGVVSVCSVYLVVQFGCQAGVVRDPDGQLDHSADYKSRQPRV